MILFFFINKNMSTYTKGEFLKKGSYGCCYIATNNLG